MNTTGVTMVAATALISFLLTAFLGRKWIPILHKLKFGQTIRDIGPAWHKSKQGTPTMGGLIFICGSIVTLLIAFAVCELFLPVKIFTPTAVSGPTPLTLTRLFGGLILAISCGAIGFVDDYIKIVKKRNLGLTARQKMFAQLLVSLGYSLSVYMAGGSTMRVPFLGDVNLGLWFIPASMFIIVAYVNATNLTDGIDGLCGTVSFVVTLFFLAAAGLLNYFGQSLAAAAFAGSLAGFLIWNLHPARVFMGDTGSLFIGGMLCAFAFGIGHPLLLVPVGIVYIAETLSVVLQITYFKLTHGKRLFKMAPLHHHYEMSGWSENKIVTVFTTVTVLGCGIAILLLLYA